MKTILMTEYLAGIRENENLLATAVTETEKAVAFKICGSKRMAWFPKSQLTFVKDNFYTQAQDQFMIPKWLGYRKAAELGIFPWDIGNA